MDLPALEARGLTRHYSVGWRGARRWALNGVDLALGRGEALGLIGPNGSGKSTLLRLLAGLERASAGCARVFGADVGTRAARRRVGHVPDGAPFPAELAPLAVLELLGALHGLARAERRRSAHAWLERVGLAREARTPLGRFSLGMLRRFALAQACLHAPEVLLLDEPSAGLDAEGHVVLDELLSAARARGVTLILASHGAPELVAHCRESCVLFAGRVAAHGPTGAWLGPEGRLLALYRELAARPA
jgi:ABC-2 type transport system ATP-binding protein